MAEDTKTTVNPHGFTPDSPRYRNGGRRKLSDAALTMLGDSQVPAIKALIDALDADRTFLIGTGDSARLETAPDHDTRIKAANSLLDRYGGRPAQSVTGDEGGIARLGVIVLPPETDE